MNNKILRLVCLLCCIGGACVFAGLLANITHDFAEYRIPFQDERWFMGRTLEEQKALYSDERFEVRTWQFVYSAGGVACLFCAWKLRKAKQEQPDTTD